MRILTSPPSVFHLMGQREYQQDSLFPKNEEALLQQHFFIVCDGVGGCEHGELASQTVTTRMAEILDNVDWEQEFTAEHFAEALAITCRTLDQVAAGVDTATTLTMLCTHSKGCLMAHIGDSRIYQLRPGKGIVYRSEDHSLVNDMVRSGKITAQEALTHPDRNIITRCLQPMGGRTHDRATVRMTNDVRKGDLFLLCSDGVTDEVDDVALCELLLAEDTCEAKANRLAALCDDADDNATAILIEVSDVEEATEPIYNTTQEVAPQGEMVLKTSIWSRIRRLWENL